MVPMPRITKLWIQLPKCWFYYDVPTNKIVHYVWAFGRKRDVFSIDVTVPNGDFS